MKTKRILAAIVMVVVGLHQPLAAAVMDRIVAVVNGEVITLSELQTAFEPVRQRIEKSYQGPDKEKFLAEGRVAILNRLISGKLIELEAKKFGFTLKDDEVMAAVRDYAAQNRITLDQLKQNLAKEGTSFEDYKQDVKDQLTRMRLIRREINTKVTVNDEEIGAYYQKHREDYEGREAVRIQQILLLFPKDSDDKLKYKLRADAEMILGQLKKKEPFEVLAAKYSQGPAAETGGDIGFVEKGAMVAEVDQAAFRLPVGEISPVIESSVGLHIIRVLDKRGEGVKPIAAVREEIKAKIEQEKMNKKFDEWIEELRKKSVIEIKL